MSDTDRWGWRNESMHSVERHDLLSALKVVAVSLCWTTILSLVSCFLLYPHSRLYAGFLFGWASVPLLFVPNPVWEALNILQKHRKRVREVRKRKKLEAVTEVLE